MLNFTRETIDTFYSEAEPLLLKYWGEADERRDTSSMDLDIEAYYKLEDMGMLAIYSVREEDKEMVGFMIFVLSPCTHTGKGKATTEISYLEPEYRGDSVMQDFFRCIEEDLKRLGVSTVFCTLKTEFPHNNLMSSIGMDHVENVYMKELV